MFKNLLGGAAVVLAVGILAVGCSDDGDTIVIGGNGPLNNSDQFPASSIASNNLAPDGGGMSPNDGDVSGVRIIYCCDCCGSDGDSTGVSNDALVLFVYRDDTNGINHLYATHFDGNSFTPPTRLRAPDRNETTAISTAAMSVVCLSTAGYSATVAADGQAVVQNAGAWVILGDYTTFFNDPRLSTTASTTGLTGVHQALAQWVFLPELRGSGLTSSDRVGATARTFENGFMTTAIQLEAGRAGAGPALASIVPAQDADATYQTAIANNVQSYGLVSDSFCGQTCYMGNGLPATPASGGTATDWNRARPQSGTPRSSAFTLGERTSHVGLFYTQIVSSLSSGGSYSDFGIGHGGDDVTLTFHSLDLKTLTFEAGITMNHPAARNAETDVIQRAGTSWFPDMYGYNQYMFIKYLDMSLNQNSTGANTDRLSAANGGVGYSYDNTGGHKGGALNQTAYYEEVIAGFCLVDDGDGTCSPGAFLGSTAGGADAGHDLSITAATAGGNHADRKSVV